MYRMTILISMLLAGLSPISKKVKSLAEPKSTIKSAGVFKANSKHNTIMHRVEFPAIPQFVARISIIAGKYSMIRADFRQPLVIKGLAAKDAFPRPGRRN